MLDDVTVLSIGSFIAAPKASKILGEFGAEVIKIERTVGGDPLRTATQDDSHESITYAYTSYNKGKKSVAMDLSSDRGAEVFKDLIRDADVLVENMSPGRMDQFGLGYEDLREVNEDIIYCSISGYGETGPYSQYKSMDVMIQAMSGLAHQNGLRKGDGEPTLTGWFVGDQIAGVHAVMSILAALLSEEGTYIDISMLDSLLGMFETKAAYYFRDESVLPQGAPGRPYKGPLGIYETATDPLSVFLLDPGPEEWVSLWEVLGLDEWAEKQRFTEEVERQENEDLIENTVSERFKEKPRDYWLEHLWEADLTAGPLLTVEQAFTHEQMEHRQVLSHEVDKRLGEHLQVNFPAIFSNYEPKVSGSSSCHGEHTRKVLGEIGYSEEEIEELYDAGVVS